MKTPPLLLGAALLFWGWQTGFVIPGLCMAVLLEGAPWIKVRWEVSDEDFNRIWTFCALLLLGSAVYAFTSNEVASDVRGFLQNPSFFTQRSVGTATARAAAAWIRWLPMIFFLFVAAQTFSERNGVPLETVSLILRRRWKRARDLGLPLPLSRTVNVSYPYFGVCLFAASIHAGEDNPFFWGLCALVSWALWAERSRRFSLAAWAAALASAVALGYFCQRGIGRLQHYIDNLNPQWLSSWSRHGSDPSQSKTALGQIGRVKTSGEIVIRLEIETNSAPPLLREASYRAYKAQTWYSEATTEKDFETIFEETNRTMWVLIPGKTNPFSVNIACYLDDRLALLPLPAGSGRLEHLPAFGLKRNTLGAVLAEGPGLVVFDACYGPGPTLDGPGNTNEDLAVPLREIPALDAVISEAHLAAHNDEERLRLLRNFLTEKFAYSTWQEPEPLGATNETPLSRFLLRTRRGHCEYFATATVLLLRHLKIPARYAVGYAVHEGTGGKYVVRQRDAHAWCLVWDQRLREWRDFDTTPPSWQEAEAQRASPLQFLSDFWSRVRFEFSKVRWGQSHLREYLLWTLAPILALLLYQILFRRRRRQPRKPAVAQVPVIWPGLDSEFYRLEQRLVERGLPRAVSEPLSAWLQRAAADPGLLQLREPLYEMLRLHYRYRFDPQGLSGADRDRLRRATRDCLARLENEPGSRFGEPVPAH